MRLTPLIAALLLCGCHVIESPQQVRGNKVDLEQLKELVPGTSTRIDAQALLGSPTAKATFDDNTWLYISETTQPRIGRVQGVNDQNVVVLGFDQGGVLRTVKKLGEDDAQPVSVVARATPSPGSEASFMQQLLGNVGKIHRRRPHGVQCRRVGGVDRRAIAGAPPLPEGEGKLL